MIKTGVAFRVTTKNLGTITHLLGDHVEIGFKARGKENRQFVSGTLSAIMGSKQKICVAVGESLVTIPFKDIDRVSGMELATIENEHEDAQEERCCTRCKHFSVAIGNHPCNSCLFERNGNKTDRPLYEKK